MSKLKEHLLSTDMSCKAQFLTEEVVCFPVSPSRLKKQIYFNVVLHCDSLKIISVLDKIKQSELGLLGTDHYFPSGGGGGGYRDFQEAGNFFLPSIERLQIFFLHSLCRQFFFKFPKFPITGVASADNFFSDAPLVQTIYFSYFSHADNFFSQLRYPPPQGKNNGPSLINQNP